MLAKAKIYVSLLQNPPMPILLVIAVGGWVVLLIGGNPTMQHTSSHHHAMATPTLASILLSSTWSWLLMLVAMMTPLLANSLEHIWMRSLPRRRMRGIALFVVGYIVMWMLAGMILTTAAQLLKTNPMFNGPVAACIALAVALIWQASPWKQASFNRCHMFPRLSAFGTAADVDCLRFGLVKGLWCVGSCWAWMFLPLMLDPMLLMMLLASLFLFLEQYQPARPTRWRIPFVVGS